MSVPSTVDRWVSVASGDLLGNDARARGEQLVAVVRLWLLALFVPVVALRSDRTQLAAGVAAFGFAAANAVALHVWAKHRYTLWTSLYGLTVDVSAVTGALVGLALAGRPLDALNSQALFDGYFLILACAGLRYDWRISVFALGVVLVEVSAATGWIVSRFDLAEAFVLRPERGAYSPIELLARGTALVGAGAVSTVVALLGARWRTLAVLDPLTRLLNRAHFMDRAESERMRALRTDTDLVLAIVDIDHFKHFNDRWGHAIGDAALVRVSSLLRELLRRSDLVARLGGEEFAVLLPGSSPGQAVTRLEAVRARIAAEPLALARGEARVTVSIGIASWPADGERLSQVLHAADLRMLEAKRGGRNRVVAPPPSEPRRGDDRVARLGDPEPRGVP